MGKAFVIAAHPDDELLGCGGAISIHRQLGDTVRTMFVAGGRGTRTNLALVEIGVSRIADEISATMNEYQPDTVYIHSSADLNSDHRMAREAGLVACRPYMAPYVRKLLAFEVLSTTDLLHEGRFFPNYYLDIEAHIEYKCEALEKLYRHELRTPPHPRCLDAVRALAAFRGLGCGMVAAEAFEVVLIRECGRSREEPRDLAHWNPASGIHR